jgi:hypothetical protein
MQKSIPVLLILLATLMTSCVSTDPQQGALDPTALPLKITAVEPQKPAVEAAPQQPATEAAPPPVELSGIWLVSAFEENNILLRAINPTGTQIVELGPTGNPGATHFAASSNSGNPWFSMFSGEDSGLTILRIPSENNNQFLALLRSKELQPDKKELVRKEFLRADQSAQVWSPDGRNLAYLDIPDGTKTRLLIYDTISKNSAEISESTSDVIAPAWSPDGAWILYQTIDGFPTQGLPEITGMYAVRSNGSENRLLYSPASLRETVLGWASADTFVVQSLIERGNRDLRLVSIKDGSSLSLNAGLIKQAGWDEKNQIAMYLLTASETNNEQPSGVYAVSASTPQRLILPGKWATLQHFQPSGLWVATLPGEAGLINPDGSTKMISNIDSVAGVSPDGNLVLLNQTGGGLGLYSTSGKLLVKVTEKPVEKIFFSPDSKRFFFTLDGAGFIAGSPDWKPQSRPDFNRLFGWVGY